MSSTAAGGTAVEYYSSVPTFIPPTSFSDTGVPTFDPNKTPSPQQVFRDLSSPASSNHAHPATPSPPPESSNPYANDPWAPQVNQSIKVDSLPPPKSPNLAAQRKVPSRFAVPAPSSGAAGYMRRAATELSSAASPGMSPRVEQEEMGISPSLPALSVTPTETSAGAKSPKSGISKDSLTKPFSRLSLSFSGRSKSGKKNSPPAPVIEEPIPRPRNTSSRPPSQHQRPVSFAESTTSSARPRSFVIPQTLEEWEAFNKAILAHPPPPPSNQRPPPSNQRPPSQSRPQSSHLRPPSGVGMLPGPRLAASFAGSPLNSPGASPRRSVVDLPPPPIVLGEWEKKRMAEAQGIPFPQSAPQPPPQQQQQQSPSQRPGVQKRQTSDGTPPPSSPSSRPASPVTAEGKRNSLFLFKRGSSGAVSPGAVNTIPTPFPLPPLLPQQAEQSPSPSRGPSLNPAAAAISISPSPPAPAPPVPTNNSAPLLQPVTDTEAAVLRARTLSLPDAPKPARPLLAPIQTDVSSPSLKWNRPRSWKGVMGGGRRARSNSVSEGVAPKAAPEPEPAHTDDIEMYEVRPRSISIERANPNSNGARMRARRKSERNSSIDLTLSGSASADGGDKRSLMSEGGRMRNLLKKRRPSSTSDSGGETGSINSTLRAKLKKKQQPQGGATILPPGAALPMLGKGTTYAVSPGAVSPRAVSPSPAAESESKDAAATEKRRSRKISFGVKNLSSANLSSLFVPDAAPAPAPNTEGYKDAADVVPAAGPPAAPAPAVTPAATTSDKRRSRVFSFGMKNASTANLASLVAPPAAPALGLDTEADKDTAAASPLAAPAPAFTPVATTSDKRRSRVFSFGMKNASTANLVSLVAPPTAPAPALDTDADKDTAAASPLAAPAPAFTPAATTSDKRRSRVFSFGIKNASTPNLASLVAPPAAPAPAFDIEGDKDVAVANPPAAPAPAFTPAATTSEKRRSRVFSFGMKNASSVNIASVLAQPAAPASALDTEGDKDAAAAADPSEKRRSRRLSFGMKNASESAASPSPANVAEGDGDKRRSRRFSFGMKNPFGKKESSESSVASPAPKINPHALLPPGAAKPAILSRAGSQSTVDTVSTPTVTSSHTSSANTTPASAGPFTTAKPPSPQPSSPLAAPSSPFAGSRSANNSSTSLSKMNLFKRKPPPSISDEPYVIVPTLNKGTGKLKLEISDAEKERLERMSAPPSLPDSRPQTPSDNTIAARMFGSGKRESFFADGDGLDKEDKIDEKNNRVSRFLSEYAANNELGLAIPSPSLQGMPLAPSSFGDSTTNSVTATDETGHSDATARGKTPDRFEY